MAFWRALGPVDQYGICAVHIWLIEAVWADLEVCAEVLGRRCNAGERNGQRCHRHAHDGTLQNVAEMCCTVGRLFNPIEF